MDTSYLTQQVTTIIGKLHSLFDEIGVPSHERDSRESELFSSLSETLHNHLKLVAGEKNDLVEEGQRIITTIQQLEKSLDDSDANAQYASRTEALKVTYPLVACLERLREKHRTISQLHQERYEQVKKLLEALESYSSHLEPSFLSIKIPKPSADGKIAATFSLSPSYINSVDNEFTRIYEEYNKRVGLVQQAAQDIVSLWAELGTPQAQTESTIVQYWRESPEQLGLHQKDIKSLTSRRDKLVEEKRLREKRIVTLRKEVESLWDRLGFEEQDRKAFNATIRGCGLRAINDLEDELSRLHELKRQNLHLFVEDARTQLQQLWDDLYFSEEEAVEFTPMFCDVYSDALLSAHEAEISRLQALKEQRAPTLQLIEKHRSLVKDREDLAASSQDASRLMAKGAKGERRDPTRLLREEKMRKRIAKDLPKIEAELCKVLESWEQEYGRPFSVFGERYLDVVQDSAAKAPPPRSKTPNPVSQPVRASKVSTQAPQTRPASRAAASVLRSKTPVGGGTIRVNAAIVNKPTALPKSPSKIPARIPLGHHNGNNSPERQQHVQAAGCDHDTGTVRKLGMAPPPKMRDLHAHAPPLPTHMLDADVLRSGSIVQNMPPEDPYDEQHNYDQRYQTSANHSNHLSQPAPDTPVVYSGNTHRMAPPPRPFNNSYAASTTSNGTSYASSMSSRQLSGTSSATTISATENWETYGGSEDDEMEVEHPYMAKVRPQATIKGYRDIPTGSKRPADVGAIDARGVKLLRERDEAARDASWATEETF